MSPYSVYLPFISLLGTQLDTCASHRIYLGIFIVILVVREYFLCVTTTYKSKHSVLNWSTTTIFLSPKLYFSVNNYQLLYITSSKIRKTKSFSYMIWKLNLILRYTLWVISMTTSCVGALLSIFFMISTRWSTRSFMPHNLLRLSSSCL